MKRLLSFIIAVTLIISSFACNCIAKRDTGYAEILAEELKELGLFRGVSDTDFDLDRAPSRLEALVMLIRILGEEDEAVNGNWNHPFEDVPTWADKYVGYAYAKGYSKGQSETIFGAGEADAVTYMTFVLRALGYSDAEGGDFKWDSPYMLAAGIGVINDSVDIEGFLRADVVIVSHTALSAYIKGTKETLAQKLIASGNFTSDQYMRIYNSHNKTNAAGEAKSELSAEEIYAKCAPAVFYIEIYDERDRAIASGSGFFINDRGMAVTNYHVIEDAYSALMQMSDTKEIYRISGVYDYSKENDWAIIQIDCSGNSYLEIGDASTANGGAKVYAIGSPLGLQNTISEGIVSNPARIDGNVTYIQTTAAISSGSSGGALLNKMGEVIGITSAGYTKGQNLNLALPISYIENADTSKATFMFEFYEISKSSGN